jgi:BirA family biotin operon repressor/biotin-[acetyl-CoA-carboxylase] ligase
MSRGPGHGWGAHAMPDFVPRRRFVDIRWFDELGSTNTWLLDAAGAGADEGTVVVADSQGAGRGRLGRRWESPPGSGLLTSILFRPSVEATELFSVSTLVALAARDAVLAVAGVALGVKWPNDLVHEDLKLAGVLAETRDATGGHPAVVVGIGMNVSWPRRPSDAPGLRATCLEAVCGHPVDRRVLLEAMLDSVERRRPALDHATGRAALIEELATCTVTIGRRVRVETSEAPLLGTAVGLDGRGELIVEVDGSRHTVAVGDVVHLR